MPSNRAATLRQTGPDFAALFRLTAGVSPLLKGELGPARAGDICRSRSASQLAQLYDYWRQTHPEAGRGYWAVRSWEMLIWQPVIISVSGCYGLSSAFAISNIGQGYSDGLVAGYRLPRSCAFQGAIPQVVARAGAELAQLAGALLEQLQQICRLRPKLAYALLSDQLASNLAQVPRVSPAISMALMERQLPLWLKAMNLPQRPLVTGEHFTIERISCCLHYRRDDGQLCDNCPKHLSRHAGN